MCPWTLNVHWSNVYNELKKSCTIVLFLNISYIFIGYKNLHDDVAIYSQMLLRLIKYKYKIFLITLDNLDIQLKVKRLFIFFICM